MKQITLTQGKVALVDDDDYVWLNQWKWCAKPGHHTFYAAHYVRVAKYKHRFEKMHRLILGLQESDKQQVDHVDGNGLNNQRSNLRICTITQNNQSRRKRKVGTSKYKGVYWHQRDHKWQSRITVNKKRIQLGCFDSETDAAIAYNRAALKCFGEFVVLNKI